MRCQEGQRPPLAAVESFLEADRLNTWPRLDPELSLFLTETDHRGNYISAAFPANIWNSTRKYQLGITCLHGQSEIYLEALKPSTL